MTEKRWMNLAFRILLSLSLLFAIHLVATRAIALWFFRSHPVPEGIWKAIEWDPNNPRYHAALGRYFERSLEGADIAEAIRHYEKAIELSPHQARYWADLGSAYELSGRLQEAQRAYARAQQLFPNSPRINWKLGNFYIRTGSLKRALPALQKALVGDPEMRMPAFDLAWRAGAGAQRILDTLIPPNPDVYFEYLNYLIHQQRRDEAGEAWGRLLQSGLPFRPQAVFPYVNALIAWRRLDELTAVWATLAERHPTQLRQHRFDPNLITNGDFESEILDGGLDWRVQPLEGVVVRVDTLVFFDGARSLQVSFDGHHNLHYHHLFQYVPVQPETSYRFLGYMRARGITTDRGPHFEVLDAYDPSRLSLTTENLVGTSSWSPHSLEFQTGSATRLLVVRLTRPPSRKFDSQIAGTVWIDRLSLNPAQ